MLFYYFVSYCPYYLKNYEICKWKPIFRNIFFSFQLFNNRVHFGRVNCNLYPTQCLQAGVKVYPTLIIYDRKYDIKDIDKGFKIIATSSEMIKEKVLNFLNSNNKNKHDEL